MKVLVMGGNGAVGSALVNALRNAHEVEIVELNVKPEPQKFDILHVAIPGDTGDFVPKVKAIAKEYKVDLIINHATTLPGTTKSIGPDVVHSPILGQHDNLKDDIYKFTKWVGASNEKSGRLAASHLATAGFDARIKGSPTETEVLKLLCLFRYANELAFYETAEKIMDTFKANKNLLNAWTTTWNDGYKGTKFARSILEFPKGKIGGTCVAQNSKLLYALTKNVFLKNVLDLFKLI